MSKAILVMDMPKCCAVCKMCLSPNTRVLMCGASGFEIRDIHKIDKFCPLKEMPEHIEDVGDLHAPHHEYCNGWNACIDEILGGGE